MSVRRSALAPLAIAALLLTGCSASPEEGLPVTPAPEPAAVAEETPEPEATETEAPAPEPQKGTRANPLAPGEARLLSEVSAWTISGGRTTFDAWAAVQAENEFNDPPADGRQFVMFPLSVTADWDNIAAQAEKEDGDISGGVSPVWSLTVSYVAADGTSYGSGPDDYCGVVPNDWMNTNPIFDSATVSGNVCVSVPADKVEGGSWAVTNLSNEAVFIAATE